ncbi:MAG: sugar phosphate isomerase/epimerase [Candidatus Omnitrophica bacterium]|nr:sugar phosphate isomerase/epimerase [Candidatus Omnitrophota bacterium]
MNNIGIMQGRILPKRLDRLQLFPDRTWEEELSKAKELGFSCVELLYDKELVCRTMLSDNKRSGRLWEYLNKEMRRVVFKSTCLDYFTGISLLDRKSFFCSEIVAIIEELKKSSIKIFVLPFFDENMIHSQDEFRQVLQILQDNNLDCLARSNDVALALELCLPAHQVRNSMDAYAFTNIKICYDTGNARASGYIPEEEIIELSGLIGHVHIKDRNVGGPNVPLGSGAVNFNACLEALQRIRYDGLMILETIYTDNPILDARNNFAYLQGLLGRMVS